MSTPKTNLEADVKAALKAGDKERLQTLRMLLADVKNEGIRLGRELEETEFHGLVQRGIKRRREASQQYRKGNRPELADKEEREICHLEPYLPVRAGDDEIRRAIQELVDAEGLEGPAAMGKVMKATLARFKGACDGATVSRIAREVLEG